MNTRTIIRLKSDNFDCFVTYDAYCRITHTMSSGDFGSHKHRVLEMESNQVENLKWHSGKGLIDLTHRDGELVFAYYDGKGDCTFEPAE
jgi:hypothetical protein